MRSRSMQALTDSVRRRRPGVVIYGKGDEAHAQRISDHNEDDTPGSKPEQTDADTVPEHRAIDIMLGPHFTRADADELIDDLLADPAARARLRYLIFNGSIWSKSRGWTRRDFDGDPHTDHVHASGDQADDEDTAGWPAAEGDTMDAKTLAALLTDPAVAPVLRAATWAYIDNKLAGQPAPSSAHTILINPNGELRAGLRTLTAAAAADETRDRAALTAIEALTRVIQAGGGDVDSVGIITAIHTEAESTRTAVAELQQQVADRDAELDQVRTQLAAALAPGTE